MINWVLGFGVIGDKLSIVDFTTIRTVIVLNCFEFVFVDKVLHLICPKLYIFGDTPESTKVLVR